MDQANQLKEKNGEDMYTFYPDKDTRENTLRAIARPGDIILTVGAGDVYKMGENLLKN